MKKLGVVITDGVGFRNFILSDFIFEAENAFDEVVIVSCLPKEVYSGFTFNCRIVELEVFEEKFVTWFFRKTKEVAHLRLHSKGNFGINDNYNANRSSANNPRGWATRFVFGLTNILHSEKWILRFNRLQQFSFRNNRVTKQYEKLMREESFSLLLFTHQRPPFIAPLAYTASKLKVKSACFIFSWDNLASKGRMAADFDYFLVWSNLMKQELLHFYSSVEEKHVQIAGTPQFEPYVLDRYQISRQDFVMRFGLEASLKTVFYSCGDIATSKNDELYISLIANAIIANKIKNVNLVVRTSPAEGPERFFEIAKKFPFISWNYPKWFLARENHQEAWSQRVPMAEDIIDLRSLLQYSDLNINVVSTMTLDFMIFDKPVIYPVFGNDRNGMYNDSRFLRFKHLEHVEKSNAVTIAFNESELINAINRVLEKPDEKLQQQRELLALEIGRPLQDTSKRMVQALLNWIK